MKKCLRPRKLGLRQFFIFEGLNVELCKSSRLVATPDFSTLLLG
jgi:hypothetical protein